MELSWVEGLRTVEGTCHKQGCRSLKRPLYWRRARRSGRSQWSGRDRSQETTAPVPVCVINRIPYLPPNQQLRTHAISQDEPLE